MNIDEIKNEISNKISNVNDLKSLNEIKVLYLGKTGIITILQNGIKEAVDKKSYGMMVNDIRNHFNTLFMEKQKVLEEEKLNEELNKEQIDITLPGTKITSGSPNILEKLVEDIEAAINGMLDPEYEEKVLGSAEVRKIFKFSKIGNIAGCYITSGIVKNGAMARVIRDGVVIASDEVIASLQREKDTVKEVKKGFECGITLEKFNDFKEGDTIEAYEMVEVKHA